MPSILTGMFCVEILVFTISTLPCMAGCARSPRAATSRMMRPELWTPVANDCKSDRSTEPFAETFSGTAALTGMTPFILKFVPVPFNSACSMGDAVSIVHAKRANQRELCRLIIYVERWDLKLRGDCVWIL